jgi:hypothetical protein
MPNPEQCHAARLADGGATSSILPPGQPLNPVQERATAHSENPARQFSPKTLQRGQGARPLSQMNFSLIKPPDSATLTSWSPNA